MNNEPAGHEITSHRCRHRRRLGGLLLAITAFMATPNLRAQPSGNVDIDVDEIASSIEQFSARLEQLREGIDESRFDPDAMVDTLDYDAELLIEFVSMDIAFQPYAGVLRGPAGALRARSGNSLDQSLLLAYMLKSAGFDARIAVADINDADAKRLLQQTRSIATPDSLDYLQETVDEILPGAASAPVVKQDWTKTNLYKDARRHDRQLLDTLASNGIRLQSSDASAQWLPVARNYFWVQHRDGPSDPWQDAHPAFGEAVAPASAKAKEYFAESVPEKYQHRFTLSAWIEQWVAGTIKTHRIMDDWTRPTANLNGVALRYSNVPNGLSRDTAADLETALANTSLLIPMFGGAMAPGAKVFDLNGQTVDPFALTMGGPASLFQALGDKLASATGSVAARSDGQPVLALHSMYLEFTHTDPSGHSDTQRRYVLAPREDYSGDAKDLMWDLIVDYSYMVSTGGEPVDFVARRFLETGIASMEWLEATVRKAFEPDVKIPLPEDLPTDAPGIAQYWLMDRRPLLGADAVAWRATPALLGIRRGYRDASTAFAGVDVVWNHIELVQHGAAGMQNLPSQAVSDGVWVTVLESVPGRAMVNDAVTVTSTARVFDLASQQGIKSIVLKPGESARLKTMPLDANAKLFVETDLANGYAVVIPERVPNGASMAGWWRVNPDTGETLGMTGDGHGSEVTEYLMDVIGIAKGLVDSLQSIIDCDQQTNNVAKMCCLVEANINNVAGLGFGGILGSTMGTTAATIFDIMNTGATAAGAGLMPSANLGCDKMEATEW